MAQVDTPRVMGILNVTPDSFSDGGNYLDADNAVHHALQMQAEGADYIDIGGESTRPGAEPVTLEEELMRVIPVIEMLSGKLSVPISVDTSKTEVMRQAVAAGASMINDINGLRGENALTTVAGLGVPVCIMHMQGMPRTMQKSPAYPGGVVHDVLEFLERRIEDALGAGISRENIIIDPGFGFGKTLEQNYELLACLDRFRLPGVRLLVGMSRKSMIGRLLEAYIDDRLAGSLAAAMIAIFKGIDIIRVHDVKETVQAIRVYTAYQKGLDHCDGR